LGFAIPGNILTDNKVKTKSAQSINITIELRQIYLEAGQPLFKI